VASFPTAYLRQSVSHVYSITSRARRNGGPGDDAQPYKAAEMVTGSCTRNERGASVT
jgi:hypothetical protein